MWEFPRRSFACERTGCIAAAKEVNSTVVQYHAFQTIIAYLVLVTQTLEIMTQIKNVAIKGGFCEGGGLVETDTVLGRSGQKRNYL